MSIIKFIWLAVLILIAVQFADAVNNEGAIPENFVVNILIFLALSVIIILDWLIRLFLKQFSKKQSHKPKDADSCGSPAKMTAKNMEAQPNTDESLFSLLDKGDIYGDGVDADQIPGTVGEFGLDANNPIPVKSVLDAQDYLSSLTFLYGTKINYQRVGSTESKYVKHPIDVYQLLHENGEEICKVYLSPYHKRNSSKKPDFQKAYLSSAATSDIDINPTQRFGQLPRIETANFQRARNIVFNKERERFLEAREELTRLYLEGYGEAMSVLGYLAIVASETEDDIVQGLKILLKCSNAGDWGSTCLLGDIYHTGTSVPHDFEKAWAYYTEAVEQGSVAALTSKGIMAIMGRGVSKDVELGRRLLTSAHERGATTAKEWLEKLDSSPEDTAF